MSRKKQPHISTFGSRATAVVSLALTLIMFGLAALTVVSAHNAAEKVRTNLTVLVKVKSDAEVSDVNSLKQLLAKAPYIQSHTYTSADAVLSQEVEYIGEDVAALLDENPYSAEFELRLKSGWANADSVNAIISRLGKHAAVEEAAADTAVVAGADAVFHKIAIVLLCVAGALLLISFVLINNTVSLSIYGRRFIIHTMKLVGATPGFIRRPFVTAGIVNGLIAGLIAVAVLAGIQVWSSDLDPDIAGTLLWEHTGWVYAALPVGGMLLCALAACWAANRYLRRNYDKLFRK